MDTESFIHWALDDARNVEERYTVELLLEAGIARWNSKYHVHDFPSLEERMEKNRRRALNPAYEPDYSERDVRRAAEIFPELKSWWHSRGHEERPLRDVKALTFFPQLEQVQLHSTEVADLSPLAELPNLRHLQFGSSKCADLRPLSRCAQLRHLDLGLYQPWWQMVTQWPDVSGLEKLEQLETFLFSGNLLAFPGGIIWPKVKTAELKCQPLAVRSLRELPQLPACEFLTIMGVETLDGIEAMPRLRNLKIESDVRSFEPLVALKHLTCFTCGGFEPVDISPLVRLPKLQCARFDTRFKTRLNPLPPRDFSPLTDAPMLRELQVEGCAPVEVEVAALTPFLLPWDEVFLATPPRPFPEKLRMFIAPWAKNPFHQVMELQLDAPDNGLPDAGVRECESQWVGRFVEKNISAKLADSDWGTAKGDGLYRRIIVTVESFAIVEKLPEIVEAIRESIARLRGNYHCMLMIALKAPPPEPSPAQKKLQEQFDKERDDADIERQERERREYLERLHRYRVKKQLGETINPEEFVPPPSAPPPEPPWEREDETDDDDNSGEGGLAVKEKMEPPTNMWDDDHPLAHEYSLLTNISLTEIWFATQNRDIAIYLMRREPDEEMPEEKKE
ncbi:MAG TPA: hypothetical protein VIK59_09200 [Verrucomicrobiae bacterium]